MKASEIIYSQKDFENPRKLYERHTIPVVFNRVLDEVDEAKIELENEDLPHLLMEILDVWVIIGSLVMHIIDELDIKPETVDDLLCIICRNRDLKYAIEFFEHHDVDEAIKISRDTWEVRKNGCQIFSANDH